MLSQMQKLADFFQISNMYTKKDDMFSNLKHNIFFVISAAAFFCLNVANPKTWIIGFIIAILLWSIAASQVKSIFEYSKRSKTPVKVISAISSVGACWYLSIRFCTYVQDKIPSASGYEVVLKCIGIIGACIALYFIYICSLFIINQLIKQVPSAKDITPYEIIIYSVLIICTIALSVYAFSNSKAFWGAERNFDIIYTSDSVSLVKNHVYINLLHQENDIRQPLFAVFSIPFMGIPFFIGSLANVSPCIQAIFYNAAQILLLWASVFMISKMMNLSPLKRACFITLCFSTYTFLLSSLMMEQYIVAFFWLSFAMYTLKTKGKTGNIAFWGAAGTLTTSAILLPCVSSERPCKNLKLWFLNMMKACICFLTVVLAFGRFDVIYNMISKISQLYAYTGKSVSMSDKAFQFTSFVKSCLVAPDACAKSGVTWQLITPDKVNLIGIFVILIISVSVILNRKKISSLIAGTWSLFSIVMLFGLGLGTAENGLILYSLYFGWAYMVLLFQLVEAIEDKLKIKFLIPVFSAIAVIVLLAFNIPAINEMIQFAITYYPI